MKEKITSNTEYGLWKQLEDNNRVTYNNLTYQSLVEMMKGFYEEKDVKKEETYHIIITIDDRPLDNFFSARVQTGNIDKTLNMDKFIDFLIKIGNIHNMKILYNDEEFTEENLTPFDLMSKLNDSIKIVKENKKK